MFDGGFSEPNLYDILGVTPSARAHEIRSAYRKKASDYHPDRLQEVSAAVRALAEEKLREINAAYEVLSDPEQRRAYDQRRASPIRGEEDDSLEPSAPRHPEPPRPSPPPPGRPIETETPLRARRWPAAFGNKRLLVGAACAIFVAVLVQDVYRILESNRKPPATGARRNAGVQAMSSRPTEGVIPPPSPPIRPPNHARLRTGVHYGVELVIRSTGQWHSFRQRTSSFWGGTTESPRFVFGSRPVRIRASGQLQQMGIITRPSGVPFDEVTSKFRHERVGDDGYNPLLADWIPFRALVARVCNVVPAIQESTSRWSGELQESNLICSRPFEVGTSLTLCHGDIQQGEVQFGVNDGIARNTNRTFAGNDLTGAYYIEVDAPGPDACNEKPTEARISSVADGAPLPLAFDSVSSRQRTWRAVHAALDQPFRVKASGQMQPWERSSVISGPEGFDYKSVPGRPNQMKEYAWLSADGAMLFPGRFVIPNAPYQALIGRFCNASACGKPFVVGAERTFCAQPPGTTLELWLNLQYKPNEFPTYPNPSIDENHIGSRRGEYRFALARESVTGCKAGTTE